MGGATIAFADSVPSIFGNPAGFSQNKQIKVFSSLHFSKGNIDFAPSSYPDLKNQQWKNNHLFETFSVAIPIQIFHHYITLAGSFNTNKPYDYQLKKDYFSTQHEFTGGLNRFNFGIGSQISPKLNIGVAWSRWLGKREINSSPYTRQTETKRSISKYYGDMFKLGFNMMFLKKLSAAFSVYLPFQLTIKNNEIVPHSYSNSFIQKQNFKGGFQFGLAYQLSKSLKTGFEYAYQHKFFTIFQSDLDTFKVNYTNMQTFSIGVEHNIQIKSISFPLYIMYRYSTMPNQKGENQYNLNMDFNIDGSTPQFYKNAVSQTIELGGNYSWARFTFYLAVRWKQTGKYKEYPPPIT